MQREAFNAVNHKIVVSKAENASTISSMLKLIRKE